MKRVSDENHQIDFAFWQVRTVAQQVSREGIRMPEVVFFQGDPRSFARDGSKNSALVAALCSAG